MIILKMLRAIARWLGLDDPRVGDVRSRRVRNDAGLVAYIAQIYLDSDGDLQWLGVGKRDGRYVPSWDGRGVVLFRRPEQAIAVAKAIVAPGIPVASVHWGGGGDGEGN